MKVLEKGTTREHSGAGSSDLFSDKFGRQATSHLLRWLERSGQAGSYVDGCFAQGRGKEQPIPKAVPSSAMLT